MVDLTVEKGPGVVPAHLTRMMNEYTELAYKIDAAQELYENMPDDMDAEEEKWLSAQIMGMCMYAHALEARLSVNGYDIRVVKDSELKDAMTGEGDDGEPGTDSDS